MAKRSLLERLQDYEAINNNPDYLTSLAKLHKVKDNAENKLKAAYGFKDLPDFAKSAFRPFRELSDIVDIFEKKAININDKLKNKKISPEAATIQMYSLLGQYVLRLTVKADLWIETMKTRKLCQKTLKSQFEKEYKKAKQSLIERSGIKNKKKTLLTELMGEIQSVQLQDRIDYMLEAYLLRWYVNYKAAIFNLKPSKLKILKTHIKEGKFTSTNINKDLKLAYKEMNKAVDLWKKEGIMSTSVYKNYVWYSSLYAFPKKHIDGKDRRYSPLPTGKPFKESSKGFPLGSKNLAASLIPKKPKKLTIVQKAESKAKGAAKSVLAGLSSLRSYANKKAKSAASSSKAAYKSAVKEATKLRIEAKKQFKSGKKTAAEVTRDYRKKMNKLATQIDYKDDVRKAYKATLIKVDKLKASASEQAKLAGGKAKEGYKKAAIELGKLKADAQAKMKKADSRAAIKSIRNKLETAAALVVSKFKVSSRPKLGAEKAPTTQLEKHVDGKISYLENWLQKKRESHSLKPAHEIAMKLNKEYREGFNKLKKARAEYNAAVKETDSAKRNARLNKLNTLINAQAKAGKISFPARLRALPKAPKKLLAKAPKPQQKVQPSAPKAKASPEVKGAKPTVSKIEFKKEGQIDVIGGNLPEGSIKLDVSKLRADLINNMKLNSDKINRFTFGRDNMNQKIAESILKAIDDKALRTAVAKKLKDKPEELIKVLKLSKKPTIAVVGRASMDGRYSYNIDLAKRRANNAKKKIEENNLDDVAHFVAVGEVVDVYGKKIKNISQMTQAWKGFQAVYNLYFTENLSVAQIKALVRKYIASPGSIKDAQKRTFLKAKLDDVRGVQLHVVKPKGAPKQIALNMKNQTTKST